MDNIRKLGLLGPIVSVIETNVAGASLILGVLPTS